MARKGKRRISKFVRRMFGLPEFGPLLPEDRERIAVWKKWRDRRAAEKGKRAEKRFLQAWDNSYFHPEWLASVRAATEWEDTREKTDAVMMTIQGESLRIQIKSREWSRKSRNKLMRRYNVVFVAVGWHDTDSTIRSNTLLSILDYEKYMEILAVRGCEK